MPEKALQAATVASSRNSIRAMGMPVWMVAITQSTASAMVGKAQVAAETASGWPDRRSVSSVIRPRVPSDPTISAVRS